MSKRPVPSLATKALDSNHVLKDDTIQHLSKRQKNESGYEYQDVYTARQVSSLIIRAARNMSPHDSGTMEFIKMLKKAAFPIPSEVLQTQFNAKATSRYHHGDTDHSYLEPVTKWSRYTSKEPTANDWKQYNGNPGAIEEHKKTFMELGLPESNYKTDDEIPTFVKVCFHPLGHPPQISEVPEAESDSDED